MASNLLSMTGYGESVVLYENLEWRAVIRSVNSRNLDVKFRFPFGLSSYEINFKKRVQKVVPRGKVDVVFSFNALVESDSNSATSANIFNQNYVSDFCRSGETLLAELDWEPTERVRAVILAAALNHKSAFSDLLPDPEQIRPQLEQLFDSALAKFLLSLKTEGAQLAADIKLRLDLLQDLLDKISQKARLMPEIFKSRLNQRIQAMLSDNQFELDPGRMTQEVAYLIDKADISEEIVRFQAHIDQFYNEITELNSERRGKKLEFVVQEMLREINTIGSKANLLEITNLVVDAKTELEKIREQVQNVV